MKALFGNVRLSATDLANHLACHHLTSLDLAVAVGTRSAPIWHSPDLWVLRERGFAHENAYLEYLAAQGMSIVYLRDILDDELAIAETFAALERGVDVIAQATLAKGRWFGWADVCDELSAPAGSAAGLMRFMIANWLAQRRLQPFFSFP